MEACIRKLCLCSDGEVAERYGEKNRADCIVRLSGILPTLRLYSECKRSSVWFWLDKCVCHASLVISIGASGYCFSFSSTSAADAVAVLGRLAILRSSSAITVVLLIGTGLSDIPCGVSPPPSPVPSETLSSSLPFF